MPGGYNRGTDQWVKEQWALLVTAVAQRDLLESVTLQKEKDFDKAHQEVLAKMQNSQAYDKQLKPLIVANPPLKGSGLIPKATALCDELKTIRCSYLYMCVVWKANNVAHRNAVARLIGQKKNEELEAKGDRENEEECKRLAASVIAEEAKAALAKEALAAQTRAEEMEALLQKNIAEKEEAIKVAAEKKAAAEKQEATDEVKEEARAAEEKLAEREAAARMAKSAHLNARSEAAEAEAKVIGKRKRTKGSLLESQRRVKEHRRTEYNKFCKENGRANQLRCGDYREGLEDEDVKAALVGKVDFVYCDPPYNVLKDKPRDAFSTKDMTDLVQWCAKLVAPKGTVFIWCAFQQWHQYKGLLEDNGLKVLDVPLIFVYETRHSARKNNRIVVSVGCLQFVFTMLLILMLTFPERSAVRGGRTQAECGAIHELAR